MKPNPIQALDPVVRLLNLHYDSFYSVAEFVKETGHPFPCDTRGWSQILVSLICGIKGRLREKGPDLADGSDVKAANTWEAIDTPRFNGCIKAGTKAKTAGKLESLDDTPYLFFVLWDQAPQTRRPRCRVWCVRPKSDRVFRRMCQEWYLKRERGEIISTNFQLHPPRGKDIDEIRNECGNLLYPLLLCAERGETGYTVLEYSPSVMFDGKCRVCSARRTA